MVQKLCDKLLKSLGGDESPIGQSDLEALARATDLEALDLDEHRSFSDRMYSRNQVHLNDHFELVVIGWKPGQASAIHDHASSVCLYLVVEGDMVEERFEMDGSGEPQPTDTRSFARGEITVAVGEEIHRITNTGETELVTIHIYSPPIGEHVKLFTPIPRYAD